MAHGLSEKAKYLMRGYVDKLPLDTVFNVMDVVEYVNAHNRQVNISTQSVTAWCRIQCDLMFVSRCEWRKVTRYEQERVSVC